MGLFLFAATGAAAGLAVAETGNVLDELIAF